MIAIFFVSRTGQKGSDVSAKETTKRVVMVTKQLAALKGAMDDLGVEPIQNEQNPPRGEDPVAASQSSLHTFQNTLVREALQDLSVAVRNRQPPTAGAKSRRPLQ